MMRPASILLMILIPVAQAQVGLPNVRLPVLPQVPLTGANVTDDARSDLRMLRDVRRLAVRDLIRLNRAVIQADRNGAAIVRGEILAVSPEQSAIDAVTAAGFTVLRTRVLEGLEAQIVVLGAPAGMDTLRALDRVRALAPATKFDFNHVYTSSGVAAGRARVGDAARAAVELRVGGEAAARLADAGGAAVGIDSRAAADSGPAMATRIGLIDGGVDSVHPVFASASIHQHGCPSSPVPDAHGTAVASLMIGRSADFHGAAPGAELYAADVYCGLPTGGAADAVADAFSWLAREHVPVINVSLVGPPNVTLETVIRLIIARGHLVVAAVGNDGPAAPLPERICPPRSRCRLSSWCAARPLPRQLSPAFSLRDCRRLIQQQRSRLLRTLRVRQAHDCLKHNNRQRETTINLSLIPAPLGGGERQCRLRCKRDNQPLSNTPAGKDAGGCDSKSVCPSSDADTIPGLATTSRLNP